MDASVRQCQFDQSWAQCRREAHRQQVPLIVQFVLNCENQATDSCGCQPAGLHVYKDTNLVIAQSVIISTLLLSPLNIRSNRWHLNRA